MYEYYMEKCFLIPVNFIMVLSFSETNLFLILLQS